MTHKHDEKILYKGQEIFLDRIGSMYGDFWVWEVYFDNDAWSGATHQTATRESSLKDAKAIIDSHLQNQ